MEKSTFVFYCYKLVFVLLIGGNSFVTSQGQTQLRYQFNEEQDSGYYIANIKYDSNLAEKYNRTVLNQLKFQFLIQPEISVSLNRNTGVLETSGRIDRDTLCPSEEICEVVLDIAIHPVQYLQIFKVILEILDNNDVTPRFPQTTFQHNILESASIGSSILIPSARDGDSPIFGVINYRLVSSSRTFELIFVEKIDGSTELKLVLKEQLDRENVDIYHMRVVARDGGSPPKEGVLNVVINVLDSNDNRPVFENSTYIVNIQENLNKGTTILRVHAVDPDEGLNGDIQYSFSTYTAELYGNMFTIRSTTGHIVVTGDLDYERIPSHKYTLQVTARDKGANPVQAETTVIINILDQNDGIPQISVNTLTATNTDIAYVKENVPNDTFVAHITVKDEDSEQNGQVDCTLNSEQFKLVQMMYEKEYKMVTKSTIDRENKSTYNVVILCLDRGIPQRSSMKHLTINIEDKNDNAPVFEYSVYNVSIEENKYANITICKVTATDRDHGENSAVVYSIPTNVSYLVSVNPLTGVVKTLRSFDREQTSMIKFKVKASDRGSPAQSSFATIILNINDVNDEPPKFNETSYPVDIMENQPPGTIVDTIKAFDKDLYPNNQTRYSIVPGNESWKFSIGPVDGKITSKFSLDREESHVYYLTVKATDVKNSFLSSTTQVVIKVGDLNDNSPVIVYPVADNSSVSISPKVPVGFLVAKVIATDSDFGDNGKLVYTITNGNEDKLFVLQQYSGYLTTEKSLKYINYEEHVLNIKISDEGNPSLASTTFITIIIDNSVAFSAPVEEKKILGNSKLVIIISLAIASSFLTVILIIAIICMRKLEGRRKKVQKHQARMEGLKILSATNMNLTNIGKDDNCNIEIKKTATVGGSIRSQGPPTLEGGTQQPSKNGSVKSQQTSGGPGSVQSSATPNETPDLWKSPEENMGSKWHATYPPLTQVPPSRSTNKRYNGEPEQDLSADGSHTTDSGRGTSDNGESNFNHQTAPTTTMVNTKPDILNNRNNSIDQHLTVPSSKSYSNPPSSRTNMRTFNPNPTLNTPEVDCNLQIGHNRPVSGVPQAQIKGAVVQYGDDPYHQSIYQRDPVRSRTYYRDTPMFTNQRQQSPTARDKMRYSRDSSKLLDHDNSTFV